MSKKSHPGDGQYGKGTKGMKKPFDSVFVPKSAPAAGQKPSESKANAREAGE